MLDLEDGSRKAWSFRYSYWKRSQTYVLTRGWRRFVKEKAMQAGDVVSFHRSSFIDDGEKDRKEEKRLYIDCKHRIMQQPPPVKLFGVDISSRARDCSVNSNGKRNPDPMGKRSVALHP